MAYEPLHHKYRPQTFAELVGQGAIAATLTNALRQQRIAPAYLFTGARGTGKTSSARILAKSLNCLKSDVPTEKPCGVCEVCRAIANGSALDVIEIDAASNTGVDNIRELIERSQFAPVQCRYKVYVLDEVHMLTGQAFNALLKTLEEPPDRVVFVLATTDPQRVLPTIISRCQRFDYRRIPLEAIVEHLGMIAAQEAIAISADALQLVAQISQGGLRDAESLLDQLSLLEGQITLERVWDLVGAVPERDLLALSRAIAADQPTAVLDEARHLMDRGREPLIVLQNLAGFYRDLLIAKASPERQDLVAITPPTWTELCEFVQTLEISTLLIGQQHLRASEVQIRNATQPRLWLEVTLLGLLPSAIGGAIGRQPQQGTTHRAADRSLSPVSRASTAPAAKSIAASATPVSESVAEPLAEMVEAAGAIAETAPLEVQATPPFLQPEPEADIAADSPSLIPAVEAPVLEETKVAKVKDEKLELSQIWEDVLALVQPFSTQMMMRQQCLLLGFSGQEARIGARSEKLFRMAKDRLPNIEAAFEKLCDCSIRVSLEVATSAEIQARSVNDPQSPRSNSAAAPDKTPAITPSPPSRPITREAAPSETSDSASKVPGTQSLDRSPYSPAPPLTASAPAQLSSVQPNASDASGESNPSSAQAVWQNEDDVGRAVKSFAQMFNGQIVSGEEDLFVGQNTEALHHDQNRPEPVDADAEEASTDETDADDDVPF